ncbi:class I SAM-dependent methyltransferase [Sphingobacterium endophyticum]|uniref:class I SAM-dependent methyltransferase n=1 Tax=Sphingobacterium endophyticum TaxID=2546448 RepID=UPI0012E1DDF1|nr:class I SAM-dependent methyltransferase [Sphingobacterium endophyticum]
MNREDKNVFKVYDNVSEWYNENRSKDLIELKYLQELLSHLPERSEILDLGCGTGKPIMEYFLSQNCRVTGVDASWKMLEIAKSNFPNNEFYLMDMRDLNIERKFDAIIAWHSFFHLPVDDQEKLIPRLSNLLNPNGLLLFTSGPENGISWGKINGQDLFHASMSESDYKILLQNNNFHVINHVVEDPLCGGATIWLAQRVN